MASGGSRVWSGPPPDPTALRRDRRSDQAGWTTLPVEGRAGEPPTWPLPPVPDHPELTAHRELEVWAHLWRKPQAVQWERLGLDLEVAMYVRRLVEAEMPGSPVSLGTLVRQLGEALGLTPAGMLRLRWRIGAQPTAAAPTAPAEADRTPARRPPARRRKSPRQRLTVVDPDGGS